MNVDGQHHVALAAFSEKSRRNSGNAGNRLLKKVCAAALKATETSFTRAHKLLVETKSRRPFVSRE